MTSSICLRDFTKEFFFKQEKRLTEVYPGLSLSILYRYLEGYGVERQMALDHLFDQVYTPGPHNLWTVFFQQMEQGVPLEYIVGRAYFYRSEFYVNQHVLIPRHETEVLVEFALAEMKRLALESPDDLKVCDVGTGCGAILLSLMRDFHRTVQGLGIDLSLEALKVAKRNDFYLRFTRSKNSHCRFLLSDRLSEVTEKQHVIVSNPPYIPLSFAKENVHPQVKRYEPHMALFLPDEIYEQWFTEFFHQVNDLLFQGGVFIMEGHEDQLENLLKILQKFSFRQVMIVNDLTGRSRFLKALK